MHAYRVVVCVSVCVWMALSQTGKSEGAEKTGQGSETVASSKQWQC